MSAILGGANKGSGLTCTAGDDYMDNSDTPIFGAAVTTPTCTVKARGDTTVEPDELFNVLLSRPSAGVTLSAVTGVGTFENDIVSFAVNDISALEGHSGTTDFTFTVTK